MSVSLTKELASDKQVALLTRLINEREWHLDAIPDPLTKRQASYLIEDGLAAPRKQSDAPTAQPGYYVSGGEVYVVVANKAGTGVYAKRLCIEGDKFKTAKWRYAPGIAASVATLSPLSIEEAAALGHMHGICVVCAKRLTDPESVQRGIGPVCIKRLGG